MKFTISETDETLVSHSGLALAGALLQRTSIQKRADTIRLGDRKRPDVSHGDVVTAMIGLLCLGKPDFEAIEAFRDDEFFRQALGLEKIPSEGTLRQRLDELGYRCHTTLHEEPADMIARHIPKLTPCYGDWIALDLDVSPFDNSGTKKEGVSWTYKKVDGYWASLKLPAQEVMELYHQHGTSEQYHSEIKTDMDLERLPSGKFATNALVLSLGLVAYNVLRLCGQNALKQNGQLPQEKRMPIRKPVARRRLRSVIQDLMYLAARFTHHAHGIGLSFWRNNPWHGVWESVYGRFIGRTCPATP